MLIVLAPMLAFVQPVQAEDMAGNWNVVAIAQDPCGKMNPMREGYYDLGTGAGWGHVKIVYKHGIDKINVWRATMTDSCGAQDGGGSTTWIYRTGFGRYECDSNGQNCVLTDSLVVRAVNQRAQFNGERKGTITMYCEGYAGFCPYWINNYNGSPVITGRLTGDAMTHGPRKAGSGGASGYVATFTPPPLGPAGSSRELSVAALDGVSANTRAGLVLTLLRADLRQANQAFAPTIHEVRLPNENTVEIVYTYPGIDGLVGLRRDVSVVAVDVPPRNKAYALAANENNPREIATMLRVDLEEAPPLELLKGDDENGISWWGSPAAE